MAINLHAPLRWRTASAKETAVLADLQGNVLKGHGRRATRHLFLRFGEDQPRARAFVGDLANLIVSAETHLNLFKLSGPADPQRRASQADPPGEAAAVGAAAGVGQE